MRIAIFCTGGSNLGYGHFFRSKAFVKAAPKDFDVRLFPIVEDEDKHFFNGEQRVTTICDTENIVCLRINEFNPEIVVFDTVFCSDEGFSLLKSKSRITISISPVFNKNYLVNHLFTRNGSTAPIKNVAVHKGFEYAVFNENCQFISDEIYFNNLGKESLTVAISMGGGDAANKTLRILKSLSELKIQCTFWVLLGEGYRHSYQELVNSIRKNHNHEIILAKTNRSMWNIFSNCSVAILAGGLTTLEAVYAGIPSLNIFENKDHMEATGKELFNKGAAENIGLFEGDSLDKLQNRLEYLNENKSQLLKMREKCKGTVDKLGAIRIFDKIKEISQFNTI